MPNRTSSPRYRAAGVAVLAGTALLAGMQAGWNRWLLGQEPASSTAPAEAQAGIRPGAPSEAAAGAVKNAEPAGAPELAQLEAEEWRLTVSPPAELSSSDLDRKLAELRWTIARRLAADDVPGAISYARAALAMEEARPERWEQLGDLYTVSGDLTSARDAANAYDNALFLDPTRCEVRLKLASAHLMNGQAAEGLRHLEFYLCQTDDPRQELQAMGVYVAACAVSRQTARGIAFCEARAALPEKIHYRIGRAILEQARGNRDEALRLLAAVEKTAGAPEFAIAYAARLRQTYAKVGEGSK